MTLSKSEVRSRLAILLRRSIAEAAPQGPFGRLKKSFRVVPRGNAGATIYSLYYWARFVNDGREAVAGKNMVFYKDPKDDPRVKLNYPQTKADQRHLTRKKYIRDKKAGKLIQTYSVAAIPATKFIEAGVREARPLARKEMRALIQSDVRRMIKRRTDFIKVQF